jgi:hypothetical protein
VASIPLEIGLLSFEILCFDIRNFSFSLYFSNFSIIFSFLGNVFFESVGSPCLKRKIGFQ